MRTRQSHLLHRCGAVRWRGSWRIAVAALSLLVVPGDALAQGKVQKVSKNLINRAEVTLKSIKQAEKQLDKVTDRYGKLLAGKSVKARSNEQKKVRDELKKLENRAREVREDSQRMESEASKFFKEWDKGLTQIKDAELRSLSQQSLTDSQQRYGQIVAAGRSVADQYDAYVRMLGSQLKYLELDMSDAAIAKLKSSGQDLRGEAKELQSRVGGLKGEISRYVSAMK
jgi:uncharacterized protein YukE